jgi:hypothetical protein
MDLKNLKLKKLNIPNIKINNLKILYPSRQCRERRSFQFSFHSNIYEANLHYRALRSFTSKIVLNDINLSSQANSLAGLLPPLAGLMARVSRELAQNVST